MPKKKEGFLPKMRKTIGINKLNEVQKIALAIVLTLAIVVGLVVLAYSFESSFVNQEAQEENQENQELVENTPDTVFSESKKIEYQKVSLFETDFYPEIWIKTNFEELEIANPLISGPESDADNDGLTNKEEFVLGSNPKNSQTFCSLEDNDCEKTDKEFYDEGYSPLTNTNLEIDYTFVVKKEFLEQGSLEKAYTNAHKEGFEVFKSLNTYKDLEQSVEEKTGQIEVKVEEEMKEDVYFKQIKKLAQVYLDSDILGNFVYIYEENSTDLNNKKIEDLKILKMELETLSTSPSKQNLHRYLTLSIDNNIKILENRVILNDSGEVSEEEKGGLKEENKILFLENVILENKIQSYSELD